MIKIKNLITLFSIITIFSINNVKAEEIKLNNSKNEDAFLPEINNQDLVGEYTLIDKKVEVYEKDGKLFISEVNSKNIKENELAKIGYLLFVLKNTQGMNIQFYKSKDGKFEKELVLRTLGGLRIDKNNFILEEPKNSPLIEELKKNMDIFRTIVETRSVSFSGTYAETSEKLKKEAEKIQYPYWKDFMNPFTSKIGLGKNGSVMDFNEYKNYTPSPSLKGLVIYEVSGYKSLKCVNDCVYYKIYGTDEKGELIKDYNGKIFYLSNN